MARKTTQKRRMARGKAKASNLEVSLEDQRRRQLVAAVVSCVSEEGFERTTMRNIAERAGVSTGLLNYYFKSKRELVTEAIQHAVEGVTHALAEDSIPYGPRRLEFVVTRSLRNDYPEPLPLNFRLQVTAAAATDNELRREVCSWMEHGRAAFQRSLEAGIASGHYRDDVDPELLSILLYGAMTGLAIESATCAERMPIEKAIEATLLVLKFLQPRRATGNTAPAVGTHPDRHTPDVLEAQLLADRRLNPAQAMALAQAFRSMYDAVAAPAGG